MTRSNLVVTWKDRLRMSIIRYYHLGCFVGPGWLNFGVLLQLNFQIMPKKKKIMGKYHTSYENVYHGVIFALFSYINTRRLPRTHMMISDVSGFSGVVIVILLTIFASKFHCQIVVTLTISPSPIVVVMLIGVFWVVLEY